jgi:hypothetical protein
MVYSMIYQGVLHLGKATRFHGKCLNKYLFIPLPCSGSHKTLQCSTAVSEDLFMRN